MSPRTAEQFKEIRKGKKEIILNSALEIFAEQGFHGASISKIAQHANISKGLIYNYFESKEDLLKEIIFNGLDEMFVFFDPNHDGKLTKDECIYFINEIFKLISENCKFWKLYFSVLAQPVVLKLIEKKLTERIIPMLKMLENYYIDKGVEEPYVKARLVTAILDGVGMHYIVDPKGFPLEETKKIIIDKFV